MFDSVPKNDIFLNGKLVGAIYYSVEHRVWVAVPSGNQDLHVQFATREEAEFELKIHSFFLDNYKDTIGGLPKH